MVRTLGFQPGRQGSIPCRAAAIPCEVTQLAECSVVTREVGGSIPPFAAKTSLSWRNWQTQQVQTLWLRLVGSTPTESTPFASLTNRVLSLRARTSKHGPRTTSASKKTTKIGHRRRLVAGSSENNGSLSDRNPTCAGGADEVSTVTSSLVPVRQGGAWLCGIWNWPRLVGIPKSYLPLFCRRTSTDLRGTQHGRYASFAPERHALERQAERWRRHRIRNPASESLAGSTPALSSTASCERSEQLV